MVVSVAMWLTKEIGHYQVGISLSLLKRLSTELRKLVVEPSKHCTTDETIDSSVENPSDDLRNAASGVLTRVD
jgi:hypothetical protein